jgi:hypothetical protein
MNTEKCLQSPGRKFNLLQELSLSNSEGYFGGDAAKALGRNVGICFGGDATIAFAGVSNDGRSLIGHYQLSCYRQLKTSMQEFSRHLAIGNWHFQ